MMKVLMEMTSNIKQIVLDLITISRTTVEAMQTLIKIIDLLNQMNTYEINAMVILQGEFTILETDVLAESIFIF